MIGCLTPSLCHVFKVKVEEASEENKLRSLSMYSFRYRNLHVRKTRPNVKGLRIPKMKIYIYSSRPN